VSPLQRPNVLNQESRFIGYFIERCYDDLGYIVFGDIWIGIQDSHIHTDGFGVRFLRFLVIIFFFSGFIFGRTLICLPLIMRHIEIQRKIFGISTWIMCLFEVILYEYIVLLTTKRAVYVRPSVLSPDLSDRTQSPMGASSLFVGFPLLKGVKMQSSFVSSAPSSSEDVHDTNE
jgi:hypothetical protein